jgi:Domain of unknown function (DUF222)
VLPRAGEQTVARLRARLARAVLVLDPQGARARHGARRKDRRVVVSPDGEGMSSLWALLSAPDATAAYQRLCQLARGLGSEDPRGMDAAHSPVPGSLACRCSSSSSRWTRSTSGEVSSRVTPMASSGTPMIAPGRCQPLMATLSSNNARPIAIPTIGLAASITGVLAASGLAW